MNTTSRQNFGAITGEVILVDSCAVIVIYFVQKKEKEKENKNRVVVLFKMELLVELGFSI
jgi:hypothetical protein